MRLLALFFALIATPLFAQPQFPLPRVYTVTGVAPNDTLNIRQQPRADSPDIGDLQPNQNVEVLALSEDEKWGLISFGEGTGWVATRFLRETPKTQGLSPDLPYGIPSEMACSGTEPFWGLRLLTEQSVTFTDYSDGIGGDRTYQITGVGRATNRGIQHYVFTAPPLTGFLNRATCDDGMSEALFGWELFVVFKRDGQLNMIQGCCTALQP